MNIKIDKFNKLTLESSFDKHMKKLQIMEKAGQEAKNFISHIPVTPVPPS